MMYFNPRTHVGCDEIGPDLRHVAEISIHAPTWGATLKSLHQAAGISYFNPRTHVGCDVQMLVDHRERKQFQSTHPRGVRHVAYYRVLDMFVFQSTHPRGVRQFLRDVMNGIQEFQSTHPRGVRHPVIYNAIALGKFQSTHPRGVRLNRPTPICQRFWISIHAPTWGATFIFTQL